MSPGELVHLFYEDVWNREDAAQARRILMPSVRFRGSLGAEVEGVEGFIAYMRAVHAALDDYCCTIEDLIEADGRAAARVRFAGLHRGELLGVPPTERSVAWMGAAFFSLSGDQISQVWVLGDVDALRRQLEA
jgi:predicted ester cyclase